MINLRRVIPRKTNYNQRVKELRNIYIEEEINQLFRNYKNIIVNMQTMERINNDVLDFFCLSKHSDWFTNYNVKVDKTRSGASIYVTVKWQYMYSDMKYGFHYEFWI